MEINKPTPKNDGPEVATEEVPSSSTPQSNVNETSSSKESTSDTTSMIANNNNTITISTPPRILIPTGKSSHTEPATQIGIGWTQQIVQKRTPSGPYGKAERYYINPENTKKFKTMSEVCQYMNNSSGGDGVSVVYTPSGNSSPSKIAASNDGKPNISNAAVGNDGGANKNLKVNTSTTTTTSINNSQNNSAVNSASNSQSNSPRPPPVATSGPGSGKSIDTHPFNKGSVIEVLYIKNRKQEDTTKSLDKKASNEDYDNFTNWDNDDESISDWFNSDDEEKETKESTKTDNNTTAAASNDNNSNNVYLADIIDRIPIFPTIDNLHPNQRFKYYIHYRNFNRRMDEWITQDRIVSPPSIGNQKVRQIKRKEERRKREEEEKRERERILNEAALGLGGGTRRASIDNGSIGIVSSSSTASLTGGGATTSAAGRKRLRRAASSGIDSGSSFDESSDDPSSRSRRQSRSAGGVGVGSSSPKKTAHSGGSGALAIPQVSTINVVTTIEAQVLDEHEGMDEIALKEHEEVTKIKNVNTLELGKYQMDTWYYSPFPKEMFRDKDDVIDVLYVDEFSLNFFTRKEELLRYQKKALLLDGDNDGSGQRKDRRHPPGNEIYRCGNLSSEYVSEEISLSI